MKTSHLVTSIEIENINTQEIYDEEDIQSSVNRILGANAFIEQSSEDWMHNVATKIEESVESYYSAVISYVSGEKHSLSEEATQLGSTMHALDQSLEYLGSRGNATDYDYKEQMLEVKRSLETEVIAPLTAQALGKDDSFTDEVPDAELDYLLRPVQQKYLDQ